MAKWIQLPNDPIYYQPDQMEFLKARRLRTCPKCVEKDPETGQLSGKRFVVEPDHPLPFCPQCGTKGIRVFDRLTVIAGRRYGKSRFGSIAAVEEACIPGSIVWACAPTNPKLHRYVIPAFQKLIPPEWVEDWNSEFKDLRLINKSLIHFQTLEDPDQGRGQGLDALWIDEVCELTDKHWEVISPSLGDKAGVAFFTTSPRSYDWVYKKLYSKALEKVPGYWGLHARTAENPLFQMTEGKEFLKRAREEMTPEMYAQEYEGDFVNFTGAIYPDFSSQILRTDDEVKALIPEWPNIDEHRQVLVGIDTGADHPFGAVKFVLTEHGLVVVGEYLERNKSFIEHAMNLKRLAASANPHWACNKNEKQGMIELAQHGIYCRVAANDQVAGIERVKSWLFHNKLWFVESKCPFTIQQMRTYRWDDNTSTDGQARKEKVFKRDDELPDCVRYALMSWPQLPRPNGGQKKERDLSHFSEEIQSTLRWLRKHDEPPKDPPPGDTGDFWS